VEAPSQSLVARLRALSVRALARMYDPAERLFVFRLRRTPDGVRREGSSLRYTAITLIGVAGESPADVAAVFGDHGREDVAKALVDRAASSTNLGDVALTLWAAKAVGASRAAVLARLLEMAPADRSYPTVQVAWALSALSLDPEAPAGDLRERLAARLMTAAGAAGTFPHVLGAGGGLRSHVSCFADLVYPIQALSFHAVRTGDSATKQAVRRAADLICARQGREGQWWWHYDHRTGRVLEGYPVYAVHQDAMAPMALFAAAEATGTSYDAAVRLGLDWLLRSPELDGGSLIDEKADLIWRKVARREPGKLTRSAQALVSLLHPRLRLPGADTLFPPVAIDDEDRPYHLGWLLFAFPPGRAARW
jgi:hypothetical protein